MTSLPVTKVENSRVTPREGETDTIPATQDGSQHNSSQDLISYLPSNQETLNNESSQTTTDLQAEFDSLGLLTQYLGPSGSSTTRRRHRTDPEDAVAKHKDEFKKKYLDLTELIDRATSHMESLENAKSKGRTPTRLRITTKPVVVRSEDSDFKIKWAQACKRAELLLMQVLLDHLQNVIKETRDALREISGQTYRMFKNANADTAKNNMEEALKTANSERTQRSEIRKKRKLEAAAGPPSRPTKRPKDN